VRCEIHPCAVAVPPPERKLRASGATVSAMLARSGATTATAAPPVNCWHPFTRRSPRVSTRTRWPDHARSWGTGAKRTCRLSFGQASELSVPIDRELLEEIVELEVGRLSAFEENRPVQFSDRLREPIAMQDAVLWNVAGSTKVCLFLWRSKNAPWTPTVAAPHAGRQSAVASKLPGGHQYAPAGLPLIKPMTLTNAKARKLHCEIKM
jgi:hypothetical protein